MNLTSQPWEIHVHRRGRVRCEPGWHLGPGWAQALDDFDLWFVWEGRGRMRIDDGEVDLHPGVCVWMRPGRRYEADQDPARRLGVNFIHFSVQPAKADLPLSAFRPPFEVLRSRQVEFVDVMMRRIIDLRAEPGAATASAALLLGGLLRELEREHATAAAPPPAGPDQRHREVMLRLAARIRESPAHTAAVADLARAAGYSVDHFSRLFLKFVGSRPQDYIIQAKIERARQLLAESDLAVGQIAEALGFQDIFYFSRQFRQRTGQAPTEFRQGRRVS